MTVTLMMPLWRQRVFGLFLAGVLLCASGIDAGHGHSGIADQDCPVCQLSSAGSAATDSGVLQTPTAFSPVNPVPATITLPGRRVVSYDSRGPPRLN